MQTRTRLTSLVVGTLALGLGVALFSPPDARADALDDKIDQLEDLSKDKDEASKLLAELDKLEVTDDERYVKFFTKLIKAKDDRVAAAAFKKGAQTGSDKFYKKLKRAVDDKKLYKERPTTYIAALQAMGAYPIEDSLEPLEDVVQKFMPTDADYATAAIGSYCKIRETQVIEQCLDWLDAIASKSRASGVSSETRDIMAKSEAAIYEGLEELTGLAIADAGTWKEWWEENRDGYEFPSGEVETVDPSTLAEFEDPIYGFKVAKPDAPAVHEPGEPGWHFEKGRADDVRVQMRWRDDTKYDTVWVEFRILNTTKQPQKTPMQLVTWWIEDWKNKQYKELRNEPAPEEVEIGGRTWVKSYAKGMSSGKVGAIEDFIYVTKKDHLLYYATIRMRLGATPDETRDEAVKCVEAMEISE